MMMCRYFNSPTEDKDQHMMYLRHHVPIQPSYRFHRSGLNRLLWFCLARKIFLPSYDNDTVVSNKQECCQETWGREAAALFYACYRLKRNGMLNFKQGLLLANGSFLGRISTCCISTIMSRFSLRIKSIIIPD
jgi:hypothetical protein